MASSKRKADDNSTDTADSHIHPDRAAKRHKPFTTKRTPKPFKGPKGPQPERLIPKEQTYEWIKKRARDIERRLTKNTAATKALQQQQQDAGGGMRERTLPPNVEADLKRELVMHKAKLEEMQGKKRRNEIIGRYHMIRFFERKKAARLQKQVQKRIAGLEKEDGDGSGEQIARLQKDLHVAEVDWNYAVYFPYMEAYISLYPGEQDGKDRKANDGGAAGDGRVTTQDALLRAERPPMWQVVEAAISEGQAALEALRDKPPNAPATRKEKSSKTRQREMGGRPKQAKDRPAQSEQEDVKEPTRAIDSERANGTKPPKRAKAQTADRGKVGDEDDDGDERQKGLGFFDF